ncbi:hypothetical protein ACJX0J_021297, partial [Zea mays]
HIIDVELYIEFAHAQIEHDFTTSMKISFMYLCMQATSDRLSWEVGGFFYHEYTFLLEYLFEYISFKELIKTLFFASNINQFDLLYFLLFKKEDRPTQHTIVCAQGIDQLLLLLLKKIMFSLLDNLILCIKWFKNVIISEFFGWSRRFSRA